MCKTLPCTFYKWYWFVLEATTEEQLQVFVTEEFKLRHIRQGNCYGITNNRDSVSFKDELHSTRILWPTFTNMGRRVTNSFILNDVADRTGIANCIANIVKLNYRQANPKENNFWELTFNTNNFLNVCGLINTRVAVMRGIQWFENDVNMGTCECGAVEHIRIGFNKNSDRIKINHFARQSGWQGSVVNCNRAATTTSTFTSTTGNMNGNTACAQSKHSNHPASTQSDKTWLFI